MDISAVSASGKIFFGRVKSKISDAGAAAREKSREIAPQIVKAAAALAAVKTAVELVYRLSREQYAPALVLTGVDILTLCLCAVCAVCAEKMFALPEEDGRGRYRAAVDKRLADAAKALAAVGEMTEISPPVKEGAEYAFDRASKAVCADCPKAGLCWDEEQSITYSVIRDASYAAEKSGFCSDISPYFKRRCERFERFEREANYQLGAILSRRAHGAAVGELRSVTRRVFAGLSAALESVRAGAERIAEPRETFKASLGVAAHKRAGSVLSGDGGAYFKTDGGLLCIILADGCGSGEEAEFFSRAAASRLETMLKAGLPPDYALDAVNSSLFIEGGDAPMFAALDLFCCDMESGRWRLFKYGSAPTYVSEDGEHAATLTAGASRPLGICPGEPPEVYEGGLNERGGVIFTTDGAADSRDGGWPAERAADKSMRPGEKASAILREAAARKGLGDDMTVLVLELFAA